MQSSRKAGNDRVPDDGFASSQLSFFYKKEGVLAKTG